MNEIKGFCRKCKSNNLYWYDGLLGYEAIKCRKCGYEHTNENPILKTNDIFIEELENLKIKISVFITKWTPEKNDNGLSKSNEIAFNKLYTAWIEV